MGACCYSSLSQDLLVESIAKVSVLETPKVVLEYGIDYDTHTSNGIIHDIDVGWEMLTLEDALSSLEQAPLLQPSVENYMCILFKCTKEKNLAYAFRLHSCICISGLEANGQLGDYLISMWVEVGSMGNAQKLFNKLALKTAYSWNILIKGYIKCGDLRYALTLYHNMLEYALHPNDRTWVALLNACASLKDMDTGCSIHTEILMNASSQTLRFVGSSLVDMYAK
eukprot:c25267_g9_i2 orf=427-1101(+)